MMIATMLFSFPVFAEVRDNKTSTPADEVREGANSHFEKVGNAFAMPNLFIQGKSPTSPFEVLSASGKSNQLAGASVFLESCKGGLVNNAILNDGAQVILNPDRKYGWLKVWDDCNKVCYRRLFVKQLGPNIPCAPEAKVTVAQTKPIPAVVAESEPVEPELVVPEEPEHVCKDEHYENCAHNITVVGHSPTVTVRSSILWPPTVYIDQIVDSDGKFVPDNGSNYRQIHASGVTIEPLGSINAN